MTRLCDFCEKREAKLKCKRCGQAYCKRCPSLYMAIISLMASTGISFIAAGFKMPRVCKSCNDDKNYLARF